MDACAHQPLCMLSLLCRIAHSILLGPSWDPDPSKRVQHISVGKPEGHWQSYHSQEECVVAVCRSTPAAVLNPSPGSPNITENGIWAALDSATGRIIWETASPLKGGMAVSSKGGSVQT